jgi:hypothetical protein
VTALVDQAEQALRNLGDLNYGQAKQALAAWHLNDNLTVAERAEVLRRFTNVDRVEKCAECGELKEHYRGEAADVWHHLGWPK